MYTHIYMTKYGIPSTVTSCHVCLHSENFLLDCLHLVVCMFGMCVCVVGVIHTSLKLMWVDVNLNLRVRATVNSLNFFLSFSRPIPSSMLSRDSN